MKRMLNPSTLLACLALFSAACGSDAGWTPAALNESAFEQDVYPVLIRDCAFHECHGAESRFFRVWGPGRMRLDPKLSIPYSEATKAEVDASYERAVAMVNAANPDQSLLLRKPLAIEAGGSGHLGADKFGRNVYRTRDDAGYLVLSRWVFAITTKQ